MSKEDKLQQNAKMQRVSLKLTCSHCGTCTRRCEVLQGPALDIGTIKQAYDALINLPENEQVPAVLALVQKQPELYNALRQCCFCGHCTAACAHHVLAPDIMRAWRELFMRANLMPPEASKLVMVDNEWHIFSAYRAIYGITYPEYWSLAGAAAMPADAKVDTLFFPGCSLVSYAPKLTRTICDWLTDSGVRWCLGDGCCGSPLMSAGLFERAYALRAKTIEQMQTAGIKRMVTICPGCADEFRDDMPDDIELVPLPKLMYELAGVRETAGRDVGFSPVTRASLTFFDSCHDRSDSSNARAIRALAKKYLPESKQLESEHFMRDALCCGAGGAVGSYDADITNRRVWKVIDEARATGAQTLITMCPTCTYTIAQANLSNPQAGINSIHYLEMLFGEMINWAEVFQQLEAMWTGEYAAWLNQTFF